MNDDERRGYASPACSRHELEGDAFAGMDSQVVLGRLNELLEGERAGARGLRDAPVTGDGDLNRVLGEVRRDEARFCAMLTHHIERLGGSASRATGAFYDKLLAKPDLAAKLRLLDRGQRAVVEALNELLGQTLDRPLRTDLEEMRDVHVRNIERCAAFMGEGA